MVYRYIGAVILSTLAVAASVPAFAQTATDAPLERAELADFKVEVVPEPPVGVTPEVLGPLRYRGGVWVSAPGKRFRGWSGLHVSADGKRFDVVENGDWASGVLSYDRNGNLAGLKLERSGLLLDENGRPFTEDLDKDAEGLDFDGSRFLVGFEGRDRVNTYTSCDAPAELVPLPPEALEGIQPGGGFSSVVALSGGRRLFLPEKVYPDPKVPVPGPTRTRGWLVTPEGEGVIWLRQSDGWLPVSLSLLPGGDLLLLELLAAPGKLTTKTRFSRIAGGDIRLGATLAAEELAVISPPTPGSRFESSSARLGPKGETLIYVASNEGPSAFYLFELAK